MHVEGARLCPLSELTAKHVVATQRAAGVSETAPVYVLCHRGRHACMATERLARNQRVAHGREMRYAGVCNSRRRGTAWSARMIGVEHPVRNAGAPIMRFSTRKPRCVH